MTKKIQEIKENKNEVVLSNGDTIVLRDFELQPPKGKDFRKAITLFAIDDKGQNKIQLSDLPNIIGSLVNKIVLKSGEVIQPTSNYYDELEIVDAQKLFTLLSEQISFFMKGLKE